jgi:hypothetical protein
LYKTSLNFEELFTTESHTLSCTLEEVVEVLENTERKISLVRMKRKNRRKIWNTGILDGRVGRLLR